MGRDVQCGDTRGNVGSETSRDCSRANETQSEWDTNKYRTWVDKNIKPHPVRLLSYDVLRSSLLISAGFVSWFSGAFEFLTVSDRFLTFFWPLLTVGRLKLLFLVEAQKVNMGNTTDDDKKCTPRLKLQDALQKDKEASLMIPETKDITKSSPRKQVKKFTENYVSGLFNKYTTTTSRVDEKGLY